MTHGRLRVAAVAACLALLAGPAGSQGVIPDAIGATIAGMNRPDAADPACLSGETVVAPEAEAAAQAGAEAAMKTYLALAGAGKGVDASAAFYPPKKLRGWERADGRGRIDRVDDPLARALAAGEAEVEPVVFIRAAQGETAIGQWRVLTPGGTERGHYWVWFRPEKNVWKITRLSILIAPARPTQTMSRYCAMPGDRELHLEAQAKREAKRARRAARAERTGAPH